MLQLLTSRRAESSARITVMSEKSSSCPLFARAWARQDPARALLFSLDSEATSLSESGGTSFIKTLCVWSKVTESDIRETALRSRATLRLLPKITPLGPEPSLISRGGAITRELKYAQVERDNTHSSNFQLQLKTYSASSSIKKEDFEESSVDRGNYNKSNKTQL